MVFLHTKKKNNVYYKQDVFCLMNGYLNNPILPYRMLVGSDEVGLVPLFHITGRFLSLVMPLKHHPIC
jgi:hypothetical protein